MGMREREREREEDIIVNGLSGISNWILDLDSNKSREQGAGRVGCLGEGLLRQDRTRQAGKWDSQPYE